MTIPQLADPAWLLLLLAVPLLIALHHRRRASGAVVYTRLPRSSKGSWRLHLPFYCRLLAFSLVAVALARPQLGYAWEETTTEGIDIQLVLDVSGSMGAEDFEPDNRLAVAKRVLADFVAGRPGDRIGLVVFAGAALTEAPATTDRTMLADVIDGVELHELPDGTAIGVALATATARLRDSDAESRIAILVTDGDNNAGEIDPDSAAAVADGLGVRVYTVAVGTTDGPVVVPVPVRNPITGETDVRKVHWNVRVDEELLQRIADRTGGRFYRATDPRALEEIFAAIDELEKTPIEIASHVRYRETFPAIAWTALGFLVLPVAAALFGMTVEP